MRTVQRKFDECVKGEAGIATDSILCELSRLGEWWQYIEIEHLVSTTK
jgi:hypothetical protein